MLGFRPTWIGPALALVHVFGIAGFGAQEVQAQPRYNGLTLPGEAPRINAGAWTTYSEAALGFQIAYPASLFVPVGPAAGAKGIALRSRNGKARLLLFGGPNSLNHSPENLAADLMGEDTVGQVTYRKLGSSWLVLSGYLRSPDAMIFYEKILFSADRRALSGFRIEYPASERRVYDALMAPIGNSLRSLR